MSRCTRCLHTRADCDRCPHHWTPALVVKTLTLAALMVAVYAAGITVFLKWVATAPIID